MILVGSSLPSFSGAGVGRYPNWTSPNYWRYDLQQIQDIKWCSKSHVPGHRPTQLFHLCLDFEPSKSCPIQAHSPGKMCTCHLENQNMWPPQPKHLTDFWSLKLWYFLPGIFLMGIHQLGEMVEKWSMQLLLIEYRDYDEDTASHRYMCVYTYIYTYIYIYIHIYIYTYTYTHTHTHTHTYIYTQYMWETNHSTCVSLKTMELHQRMEWWRGCSPFLSPGKLGYDHGFWC